MKFCPEHFPVGTIVKLQADFPCRVEGDTFIRTVTGIVRNGAESYCIKTGLVREHTGEEGCNIDWIESIIERGKGPVQIEHGWYGFTFGEPQITDIENAKQYADYCGYKQRKGFYVTGSIGAVLRYEVSRVVDVSASVDMEKVEEAVIKQSWCLSKTVDMGGLHLLVSVINKKRLRKFIQRNVNRFRARLSVATKAYSDMMDEIMNEDFDFERRDFDRIESTPPEESHYDDDDRASPYDDSHDANLSLPNHFVTCFPESQIGRYTKAIELYAQQKPEHGLVIDTSGTWNPPDKDPALLCYDRGDLRGFWKIFEATEEV